MNRRRTAPRARRRAPPSRRARRTFPPIQILRRARRQATRYQSGERFERRAHPTQRPERNAAALGGAKPSTLNLCKTRRGSAAATAF